jgi:DNA polymerase IV
MPSFVLHVDLDQFIAAVELLRRPELVGKPVVVGGVGDPTMRGVVMTASYEARRFGVHSGMALRTALKRCPEAVFLAADVEHYRRVSRTVMDTLRTLPARFEEAGWDEAFLEVHTGDPEAFAAEIRRRVGEATRLSCSVGVGQNKLQAKIASGMGKPGGVFRLTGDEWHQVMDGLTTDALWGIGRKRSAQLTELGIRTVGALAGADEEVLARRFGPATGPWLRRLALGEMDWPVSDQPYQPRSRGREHTFQRDLTQPEDVRAKVATIARALAEEVRRAGRPAVRVVVKVRFVPFFTATHGVRVDPPAWDEDTLERAALAALERFELTRPVRLLGVRAELASAADHRAFPEDRPEPG